MMNIMNLYYVTNGYIGCGEVGISVLAKCRHECRKIAEEAFKVQGLDSNHKESYWTNLKIEFIEEFEYKAQVVGWNAT